MIRDKYNLVKHGPCDKFVSLAVDGINKIIANNDIIGTLNVIFPDKTIIQLQTEPINHISISLNYLIGFGYDGFNWWKINRNENELQKYSYDKYNKHNIEGPITTLSSWFSLSRDKILLEACFLMDSKGSVFLIILEEKACQVIKVAIDCDQICHNNFHIRLMNFTDPVARILIFDYENILTFDVTMTTEPASTSNGDAHVNFGTVVESNVLQFPVDQLHKNHDINDTFSNVTIHNNGKNVIVCTHNGKYFCFNIFRNRFVKMTDEFPYGPFPCQPIGKVISGHMNSFRRLVTVFDGGLPEVTYRGVNSLSVAVDGESEICLLFQDPVIDFHVVLDDQETPQKIDEIIVMTCSQLVSVSYDGNSWTHSNFFPISCPVMSTVVHISDIIHVPGFDDSEHNTALFITRDTDHHLIVWSCRGEKKCIEKVAEIDMGLIVACVMNEIIEDKKPLWPQLQKCGVWSRELREPSQQVCDSKLQIDEVSGCISLSVLTKLVTTPSTETSGAYDNVTYLYRFLVDCDEEAGFSSPHNSLLNGREMVWNYPLYELVFGDDVAIKVESERKVVKEDWYKFKLLSLYKWSVCADRPDLDPMIEDLSGVFMTNDNFLVILNNFVYLFDVVNMTASSFCFQERMSYGKKLQSLLVKSGKNSIRPNGQINYSPKETRRNTNFLVVSQSETSMKIIYCDRLIEMYLLKFELVEKMGGGSEKVWNLKSVKKRRFTQSKKTKSQNNRNTSGYEDGCVSSDRLMHLSMIKEEWYKQRNLSYKSNCSDSLHNSSTLPSPSISSARSSFSFSSRRSTSRIENMKILCANHAKLKLLDGRSLRTESKFNVHIPATSMNSSVSIGRVSEPIKIDQSEFNKHRYNNASDTPFIGNSITHCIVAVSLENSDNILIISVPKLNVLDILTRDPLVSHIPTNLMTTDGSILIGCANYNQSEMRFNQIQGNGNLNKGSTLILQSEFESQNNEILKNEKYNTFPSRNSS